jgi:hypothetical protein
MIVRSAYVLKAFATYDEAEKHHHKISRGAGKHSDSRLEVHYDPKARPTANLGKQGIGAIMGTSAAKPWRVMVMDEVMPPGAKPCAECEEPFFGDDYLCDACREAQCD